MTASPVGEPYVEDPAGAVIEQLRQLWVMADEDSIAGDLLRARALVAPLPPRVRSVADEFVVALERLERWLRDF